MICLDTNKYPVLTKNDILGSYDLLRAVITLLL